MKISSGEAVEKNPLPWCIKNYVSGKWLLVVFAIVFMAIEGLMLGFISYAVKELFDTVFVPQDKKSVLYVGLLIFTIFSIRAISGFLQRSLILRASIEIISKLQKKIAAHIIDLDYEFFFDNSPGYLIERIKGDGQIIQVNFVQIVMALGRDSVSLLALLSVAFWIDWRWALISLLGIPILIIPILLLQKYILSVSSKSRVSSARVTTLLDEAFHGVASIKQNGIETYIKSRIYNSVDKTRHAWIRSELGIAGMPALIDLVAAVGFLGVMIFGGMEIISGKKSIGDFMSFFTAMALIFEPLRRLSNVSGQLQLLNASLERVFNVSKIQPNITYVKDKSSIGLKKIRKKQLIEFDNVCLSYGDETILKNVSLKIEKDKFVSFVGVSGSGKTTMLNLISRLIEPTSGEIYLNGKELKHIPIEDLRKKVSVVTQENNLFDDTIRQNIILDAQDLNEDNLSYVLDETTVNDFILNFDGGLNFKVGPRGMNLSGGQRQRVALARAFLRDTEILLLDEPTSALDPQTSKRINSALKRISGKRKTIILTTHKLDIAMHADVIFVFRSGQLVDQGSHFDLINKAGPYKTLWESQNEVGGL